MGTCCCKDNVLDMKVRQRKQRVTEIYKKYSKRKCYICDNIKYGKLRISITVCFLKPDIMLGYNNEKQK